MKKLLMAIPAVLFTVLVSCGGDKTEDNTSNEAPKSMVEDGTSAATPAAGQSADAYDANRGEGKWTAENVKVGPLDATMATLGEKEYGVKCASCHKLTDERLVGPGWKDVTKRRTPEWLMNFITNPDPMIDKDPEVQAQLELCMVRMPNQNLTDEVARGLLEFMRKNDGVK